MIPLYLLLPLAFPSVAVSADGNYHDLDDVGATAMTLALLSRAGAQQALVHYQYASHLGANDPGQHQLMEESATWNLQGFGIDPSLVFDAQGPNAVPHLARQIAHATAASPLYIIVAGPWESVARSLDLAPASAIQHVTILSHSDWNDGHEHVPSHRTKDECLAQFPTLGYVKIPDQNGYAFRDQSAGAWEWLRITKGSAFALERTKASAYAEGDMSDAGMMFYFLLGIDQPTEADLRAFFGL